LKAFYLNNAAISELLENSFGYIAFDSIRIENALNLLLIDSSSFSATNLHIHIHTDTDIDRALRRYRFALKLSYAKLMLSYGKRV
jgi:hypothetical protein